VGEIALTFCYGADVEDTVTVRSVEDVSRNEMAKAPFPCEGIFFDDDTLTDNLRRSSLAKELGKLGVTGRQRQSMSRARPGNSEDNGLRCFCRYESGNPADIDQHQKGMRVDVAAASPRMPRARIVIHALSFWSARRDQGPSRRPWISQTDQSHDPDFARGPISDFPLRQAKEKAGST